MKRPSHATVVAYLALFAAIGGTGFAAAKLGSSDIARNAIRAKHVGPNALGGDDIDEATLALPSGGLQPVVRYKRVVDHTGNASYLSATAECEPGEVATGGGGRGQVGVPALDSPSPGGAGGQTPTAWTYAISGNLDYRDVEAWVVCVAGRP